MRLTGAPELPPGQCFVTGNSVGPFIDTFVDIDDRPNLGRVYLSVAAVCSMAQEFGDMVPREAADEVAQWRDRALRAEEALARYHAAKGHLTDAVLGLIDVQDALNAIEPINPHLEDPMPDQPAPFELETQFLNACAAAQAEADLRSGALDLDPLDPVHAALVPDLVDAALGVAEEKPKRGRGKAKDKTPAEKVEPLVDAIVAAAAEAKADADGTTPSEPGAAADGDDSDGVAPSDEPSAEGATTDPTQPPAGWGND